MQTEEKLGQLKRDDWNAVYQRLLDKVFEDSQSRANDIEDFSRSFVDKAKNIVKTIVLEEPLKNTERTIPEFSAGGVAGGRKYLSDNIFFKYARDVRGLYGSDELARKAASNELRAYNHLVSAQIPGMTT